MNEIVPSTQSINQSVSHFRAHIATNELTRSTFKKNKTIKDKHIYDLLNCTGIYMISISTEIFRSAAEAGAHDILKLHNTKGNLISISPKLPENTPDSRYRLQVVAAQIGIV